MSGSILHGLTLDILRGTYDSTLNSITSRALGIGAVTIVGTVHGDRTVVPLPADSRVVSARDDRPAVALASNLRGTAYLAPVELSPDGAYYLRNRRGMAGGAYAASSDSRISELVASYIGAERFYGALSVHDRFEG
jgi:hypothetical protein